MAKKKGKKIDLEVYIRPAARQDIVYLVNWLQSDDFKNNYLTDYPVDNKKILKDLLLREISLAKLVTPKKQILVAEVNGEYLVGAIFLSHLNWQSRHLDLQIYFPPEYRETELIKINLSQIYEYIFGTLNMNKFYTYISERNKKSLMVQLKSDSKPEAVLPEYIRVGEKWFDMEVYATFKKDVLK